MLRLPYYHVDAFAHKAFGGNPAGVCPLERWLPDTLLQNIAAENNLSETAFFVKKQDEFDLRWFTPALEVDLCGHATLAAAFIIFSELGHSDTRIRFDSRSGPLGAARRADLIELEFPAWPPQPCSAPEKLLSALGGKPAEVLRTRDYLAVFDSPAQVARLQPNMDLLAQLDCLGVIVTAPDTEADFVSRFFAPQAGIPEDPVTGSAHCSLVPYWARRLGKEELFARQISKRGGELQCRCLGDRVGIGGRALLYSRGELRIDDC